MLTCSLQSGSNGNCIYVETPSAKLLFDAGISGKSAQQRLAQHHRDIRDIDALIISHDHSDHARCAGIFQRKFKIPIYITQKTLNACYDLGPTTDLRHFTAGRQLIFGDTIIDTIPTPHDAADGIAFVITHNNKRLGIFTDLGHPFAELDHWLNALDALYLESNYDPDMLDHGPYPHWLKNRIKGRSGHLSNPEAAALIKPHTHSLQFLILAHLSEHNNTPRLALTAAKKNLPENLNISHAPRTTASTMYIIQ